MKKYLIVSVGLIVLLSACSKDKVELKEKPVQAEKKDITEDKNQSNYDIERKCRTFPMSEKGKP